MKLADFIDQNREQILLEWEGFAGTILPVTAGFSSVELRDDVKRLLVALALDMRTFQSHDQQQAKAEGRRPWWKPVNGDSPAHSHAQDRFRQGFDLDQRVSDLLDFARTRSGELLPVQRAPMDLAEVGRQSIAEAEAFHPAAVLQFQAVDTLQGEWDRERIAQLLSNLISNAVQHGLAGTPISVALTGTDTDVSIAVHNDGSPIPEDDRRRIFQPMVQGSGGQQPSSDGGLGLGLFIVREIVYAHGGTISLESSEEAGTTFTVTLPRRKP